MKYLALIALVLLACPKPAPPKPPLPEGVPACQQESQATTNDICDGYFTPEGYACTNCLNVSGCVDISVQVYCVAGGCISDPLCRVR